MSVTAIYRVLVVTFGAALFPSVPCSAQNEAPCLQVIQQAALHEKNQATPDLSTAEFSAIAASGSEPVLDVRSALEYAIAHVPGSINLFEKEVDRITQTFPDRTSRLVLYCNGPFCGKSKRVSEALVRLGYTNVRRYQLGMPTWRALGNTVQTDLRRTACRRRGRGHPGRRRQPGASKGSRKETPVHATSFTLRVTRTRPWTIAVAAMSVSMTEPGRLAIRRPHRSATRSSTGRMRSA